MSLFPSVLRTVVPLMVGWILTASGALHIPMDTEVAASGATVAVTAAYYLIFRCLEEAANKMDQPGLRAFAGLLLGWAKPPKYAERKDIEAVIRAVREDR